MEDMTSPTQLEKSPTPEPPASASDVLDADEGEKELTESQESGAADLKDQGECNEDEPQAVNDDQDGDENGDEIDQNEKQDDELDDIDGAGSSRQQTSNVGSQSNRRDDDSFEARQAERKRRREVRNKELKEISNDVPSDNPLENGTSDTTAKQNGVCAEDSYEARKEARRKAREERHKTSSSSQEGEKKLSYRERKALEAKKQLANAKDSRKQWENREEDSGSK